MKISSVTTFDTLHTNEIVSVWDDDQCNKWSQLSFSIAFN